MSLWLCLVLILCFLFPVFAFAFLLPEEADPQVTLLVVLLYVVTLYLLDRKIDDASRGLVEGVRGEILVGRELEKLHKEGFHVFHDYLSEGRGNVDHFVIGEPGVFAVETKAWDGEITFKDGRFLVNGKPTTMKDPIKQVKGEAKDIHELVQKSCGIYTFVHLVVCFSKDGLRHYEAVCGVEVTDVGSLNRVIMQLSKDFRMMTGFLQHKFA